METVEIIAYSKEKMKKSIQSFENKLSGLRTGQASIQQFENINIDCYGSEQPLSQISNISVSESRQVIIKPWDSALLPSIEKALSKSNMSINPQNDGKIIRIIIPPLTDETRKMSIKQAKELCEEAKVSIRNIRKDANEKLKKQEHNGEISEDEFKKEEKNIQELTDKTITTVQTLFQKKEQEIMSV